MDETLERNIGQLLLAKGLTLAAAESCTGGLIGHRITNIPGSSEYYLGSVTAYAYEAKVRLVGVTWDTLNEFGAVSDETVAEMARGVRQALDADIGIAVSGIAGPGGGTPEKPVGLVYFGLSTVGGTQTRSANFEGSRIEVKEQAADFALMWLVTHLSE